MSLHEILLGLPGPPPRTLIYRPPADGQSVLLLPPELEPAEAARALRETLSAPLRGAGRVSLPFVRVAAVLGGQELEVADDATGAGRMLATHAGGRAELLEVDAAATEEARDERIEVLLSRIALAFGTGSQSLLAAALETPPAVRSEGAPAQEAAYLEAEARAAELAQAVRAVDDRMTASVVPDWLFLATGLGGVGVLLTVVALLYPEHRALVVPLLVLLSVLGFGAYALRSARELSLRGALMEERRRLRAARESARAEARARAAELRAAGGDPARALLGGAPAPRDAPAILPLGEPADPTARERQVLWLASRAPPGWPADRVIPPRPDPA